MDVLYTYMYIYPHVSVSYFLLENFMGVAPTPINAPKTNCSLRRNPYCTTLCMFGLSPRAPGPTLNCTTTTPQAVHQFTRISLNVHQVYITMSQAKIVENSDIYVWHCASILRNRNWKHLQNSIWASKEIGANRADRNVNHNHQAGRDSF